jgi:hypothetical protein
LNFNDFYTLYPRKMGRKDAEKAWNRLTPVQQAECLEAMPNYLKYWKIKETAKDYIPYPASFLNAERWTDEIDIEPIQSKKPELPWYSSEELTKAKAQEVGCPAYAGEGWQQWRARISQKIKQLDEQL